jgi:dihydrofolate reductase
MGKVIITVQMSADASIGPDIGWFDGGAHEEAGEEEVRLADAFLLGRKTYENLHPIWLNTPGGFAERVNEMPKYVVSNTLGKDDELPWNAELVTGDLVKRVRELKEEHTGDLLVYGCGEFAFELVKNELVDEVHFWVHPVVWDENDKPFHRLGHVRMRTKDTRVFSNGVVFYNYEPVSVDPS